MANVYPRIEERLASWMVEQPVFFVATAPDDPEGLVNCSPKGNRGELAVLDDHTVAYLDQTGSGVETVAHLRDNGRIVVMFCAFSGPPRIVRLHGHGHALFPGDEGFAAIAAGFPGAEGVGVRSVVVVDVTRVADSCGYGVPLMTFDEHRPTLDKWSARKGPEGIRDYWAEKNQTSIGGLDGLPLPSRP
jgi:hypothetical protein